MSRPTRPAGCFLQIVGGLLLVLGVYLGAAGSNLLALAVLGAAGLGLLLWGRTALKR